MCNVCVLYLCFVLLLWCTQGGNFYHSFIESFPLFLTLGPILHANPGIPILGLPQQVRGSCSVHCGEELCDLQCKSP